MDANSRKFSSEGRDEWKIFSISELSNMDEKYDPIEK
jgi:hypothetical protein